MFRLLSVLCIAMFLALLIGGRDHGQVREGLRNMPEQTAPAAPEPVKAPVLAAEEPKAEEPKAEVLLTAYVPVAAPDPVLAQPTVAEPSAATEDLAPTTFSLDNPAALLAEPPVDLAIDSTTAPAPVLRYVAATAVNVRLGPSTDFGVVGRLTRNEAVSVVEEVGDGWVRIRIQGDGIEGFVASRLLTDQNPVN